MYSRYNITFMLPSIFFTCDLFSEKKFQRGNQQKKKFNKEGKKEHF